MLRTDVWGAVPGLTTATETYEAAFRWGQYGIGVITGGYISSTTLDPTNTPTFELRPGLVLGQITSNGQWKNYDPAATDGSDIAAGVLMTSIRVQDLQGTAQARFYGILVGGPVQSAKLIGLDLMARQQMDKFQFDDSPLGYNGNHWYPYKHFVSKTINYQILASDNYTIFDNAGAAGEVDFTLPAIARGYFFAFKSVKTPQQILKVISAEGANIVAFNNAAATSVAFQTGGAEIGGGFRIYSNQLGTLWHVEQASAGANTVTTA
jgi:hypothetical protein